MALLDDSGDPLRTLVEEALERHAIVVPVLVQGVQLPSWAQLPESLQPLARLSSVELAEEGWQETLADFAERFVPHLRGQVRMVMGAPPEKIPKMKGSSEPAPSAPAKSESVVLGGSAKDDNLLLGNRLARIKSGPPPGIFDRIRARIGELAEKMLHHQEEPPLSTKSAEPGPSGSEPPAEPESEPIWLGASAPKAVKPGDEFTARFVAYEKQLEEEVRQLLKQLSPKVEPVLGVRECRWQHGTQVTVKLSGRGLTIDPAEQPFVWNGGRSLLEFDVEVPREAPEGKVVLKFDVVIEGIMVARLRLDLEITLHPVAGENAMAKVEPAKSAFVSYSSKDRLRVLDRVASIKISAGIDPFLDCLDLHPGEEWKPRLDDEIRRRDLFLLFWSKNASESEWVVWELDTALKKKGEHAFQLHPLDPDVKLPEGLEELHVGDVIMWVRKGYEASLAGRG
ncbi:MAG: toll/interleukin-1 receptor domain-containing protein [Sulfurimicrobium sp.]|nr:toll/interleukin-1 receptor domain-containing protein [Sulfurimicrobium sp.]